MAGRSFAGDAKAFGALAKDLAGDGLARTNREIGERAKRLAAQAAAADLGGDAKFSGWVPELETQFRSLRKPDQGVLISPTKRSAGPWTVAERGRNQGNAGGFAGPGVNRRTGATARRSDGTVRRVRASRGRRWNGTTQAKNTASDAVALFERQLLPLVERGLLELTKKHLG
jgi:hypothetical protein